MSDLEKYVVRNFLRDVWERDQNNTIFDCWANYGGGQSYDVFKIHTQNKYGYVYDEIIYLSRDDFFEGVILNDDNFLKGVLIECENDIKEFVRG